MKTLVLIVTLAWPLALSAQGFELKIPRGPSWEAYYDDVPECQNLIKDHPLSIYGLTAEQIHPTSPGLTVTDITAGGPASNRLRVGDLLISVNGNPFLSSTRGTTDPFKTEYTPYKGADLSQGYGYSRGVYLFGYRNNIPIEVLLLPCDVTETNPPFLDGTFFGELYDSVAYGVDLPLENLIVGFSRGKAAANFTGDISRHLNRYQPYSYCYVKQTTKFSITRTEYPASNPRPSNGTEVARYSYSVDLDLYGLTARYFDYAQNDTRIITRDVEVSIARIIDRGGCETPEWKGFEEKVYAKAGAHWHHASTRLIDFAELGLPPPQPTQD